MLLVYDPLMRIILLSLFLLLTACRSKSPNNNELRNQVSTVTSSTAAVRTTAVSASRTSTPSSVTAVACKSDSVEQMPSSQFNNTLPRKDVAEHLRTLNDLCGDSWCEGSFEYFFYKLGCDVTAGTCVLEFRMYDGQKTNKSLLKTKWSGRDFKAEVKAQNSRDCCSHPGITDAIVPCIHFDVRCELAVLPFGSDRKTENQRWLPAVSNCIRTLESGIRKSIPEFR